MMFENRFQVPYRAEFGSYSSCVPSEVAINIFSMLSFYCDSIVLFCIAASFVRLN